MKSKPNGKFRMTFRWTLASSKNVIWHEKKVSEMSPKANHCLKIMYRCEWVCVCTAQFEKSKKKIRKKSIICGGGGNKHEREDRALQITKSYK